MKKLLLLFVSITFSSMLFSQECVEVFISEYVEGWSNNKAIELYNPTDQTIDLSNYRLERYSNGSTSAPAEKILDLSGIMPPLSVYVIVIDKRDPDGEGQEAPVWEELQAKADTFACPFYADNNVMYFNGNDAMVLKNTSLGTPFVIDRLGKVGEDPGNPSDGGGWNDVAPNYTWSANGATSWTANHSLIRKSDVLIGDFNPGNTFNVSEQWDSIPPVVYNNDGIVTGGNWASLGSHTCACGNVVGISEISNLSFKLYPNPATDVFTIESESKIIDATVYNAVGMKVFSNAYKTNKLSIETADWSKGYYLVNLRFENGYVLSKRVMIH
jgi:hypothetical protein